MSGTDFPSDILYLAHRVPFPPDKGDRIRTYHILRFLAAHAHVHLACLADEPVTEDAFAALKTFCKSLAIVPLGSIARYSRALGSFASGRTITEGAFSSAGLRSVLREWAQATRFRAVLGSASSMAPYLHLPELCGLPAVVDVMDVDSEKWFDYAAAKRRPRSWLFRTEGRRLRRLEQALARRARIVTVSDAEAGLFRSFCPTAEIHPITNGVDLDYFEPSPAATPEQGCVFVGAFDYFPNVDAACWFSKEVWPQVRRHHPHATLRLVGRQPAPEVRRLSEIPGVEVVGQVSDVRPHVAGAAVAVAPLRIARGLQNKVLEAMAMAKPVVASPEALTGLGDKPDLPALGTPSLGDWVEHIVALLSNPTRRRELGSAGRRYVEAHHDWDRCLEPFARLLGLERINARRSRQLLAPGVAKKA